MSPERMASTDTGRSSCTGGADRGCGGRMADAREVGRRFIDAFNAHDQRIRDLNGDNTVFEAPGEVNVEGRDAATDYAMAWVRAFPDARITVHNEIVGGEGVVQEFTFTGTHEDTLMSPALEIAPTHKTLPLRRRDPVPDAPVEAAREGMQLVVDAGALAARVAKVDDTHLILILEFSPAEDADRIPREVGAPGMRERIRPLLAGDTERSVGEVIASAEA